MSATTLNELLNNEFSAMYNSKNINATSLNTIVNNWKANATSEAVILQDARIQYRYDVGRIFIGTYVPSYTTESVFMIYRGTLYTLQQNGDQEYVITNTSAYTEGGYTRYTSADGWIYDYIGIANGYTALRNLFTNTSNAIKSKKPSKAITNLDINALLLRKTGKQIQPNELDRWMDYISTYGWYRGEDAYNYFFLIPDGLKDTYDRDLGAGIYFIATTNGTGIQEGTFTAEYMKDTWDRDFVRFTNHTGSTVTMTGLDTFYYSSGSKKYFTKSWSQISVYNNDYRDFYITMAIDKGYQPSDCLFFNNDISEVPIPSQDFPEEILNLDVGYPRPDYFEETKAQIITDFPELSAYLSSSNWNTIKDRYLQIPNASIVACQIREHTFWKTYLVIGIYDSKYTLVDSYDGSYGSMSYGWALFPNTGKQNYTSFNLDINKSNDLVQRSQNTFIYFWWTSYDLQKKVDYHRTISDTSKSLNNLLTAIADAIRVKKGNQSLITAANFPTEIGALYKDILTAKNMNNWTIDGTVTVTYSNEVNDITYNTSSAGHYTDPYGNEYAYRYPCSILYNHTKWYLYSDKKMCLCDEVIEQTTSPYHTFCGLGIDPSDQQTYLCTIGTPSWTDCCALKSVYPTTGWTIDGSASGYTVWDANGNYPKYADYFCDYDISESIPTFATKEEAYAYLIAPDTFSGYSEIVLTVVSGSNYSFEFEACSPTGFTADMDQISVVSGNNTVTETFNNTQTSTYSSYTIPFTADGTSATIKFDFSKMVNGSNVELLIKNMKVYKLT